MITGVLLAMKTLGCETSEKADEGQEHASDESEAPEEKEKEKIKIKNEQRARRCRVCNFRYWYLKTSPPFLGDGVA